MGLLAVGRPAAAVLAVLGLGLAAPSAWAADAPAVQVMSVPDQVDTDVLVVTGGFYDFNLKDNEAVEFGLEYRSDLQVFIAKPFIGTSVTTDGALYSFGRGHGGKLGHNDQKDRYVPTLVAALAGTPVRSAAATLLTLPAGRILLGVAAATLLFLAAAMTYTGVRRTFLGDLDLRALTPAARATIERLGVAGHLSRALALATMGVLAGRAALVSDADLAGGIAAALRALGESPLGAGLVVLVAAGIAAFGLFCLADAATRRA